MLDLDKLTDGQRALLSDEKKLKLLPPDKLAVLLWQVKWASTAREKQRPPEGDWSELGVLAGRGFGKLLQTSEAVPTPSGWTTMGALKVGDEVFDENGVPCRVTGTYSPPITQAYRLTFSDGETLVADADHQWVTWTHRDRKQYLRHGGGASFPKDWVNYRQPLWNSWGDEVGEIGPRVRSTQNIVDTLTHSSRRDANHCIPVCGPLRCEPKDLPVNPWVLGYWLGNGAVGTGQIACHDEDVSEVRGRFSALYETTDRTPDREFYAKGLMQELRTLGVLDEKHVPAIYMRAEVSQRWSLLAGLLDSDGHCTLQAGHIEFCSMDRALADGVVELARSLGQKPVLGKGRAKLNGKDYGEKYRVKWRPTVNPFSLPRKAKAYRDPDGAQGLRNRHRMIVAAEPMTPEEVGPMCCISVDSPNRMYLAGRGMIPTHNTLMGAQWTGAETYFDPMALPSAVIAPTLKDVREVCFEGPAGLLAIMPPEIVTDYNKTNLKITIQTADGKKNTISGFSAEEPERLRGPQFARIWGDELAAWTFGQETWDMAMMGLRLGPRPQVMWTTTPKPKDIVRKLVIPKASRIIVSGSTYENREHLPKSFFEQLTQYEGTQLGRQELEGELIDAEEGGIVARSSLKIWPARKPLPVFDLILMSLDTAFTEKTLNKKTHDPDSSACGVFGTFWYEDVRQVMLLDCWAEQIGMPDLIKKVKKEMEARYGDDQDVALIKPMYGSGRPGTSGRKPDMLVIEDKGSGISLRQMLDREGILAHAYNPGRADKLTRLHIVSPVFARGQFWVPESDKRPGKPCSWVEPLIEQLCSFRGPNSIKHDDFVDVCSQALRLLLDKDMLQIAKRKKPGTEEPVYKKPFINPYAA